MSNPVMWQPGADAVAAAAITRFAALAVERGELDRTDYASLHRWSVSQPQAFWSLLWEFAQVRGERGTEVLRHGERMPGARWFPEARLNFAQNLLWADDHATAIVFRDEDGSSQAFSYAELRSEVARLAGALRDCGVGPGDRVAAFLPNVPFAVIGMLASASLGAVWSSSSPDFGVQGVLDRFGQIEPCVLLAADGYHYNGKAHDCLGKLREIAARLPGLRRVVVAGHIASSPELDGIANACTWQQFVAGHDGAPLDYPLLPFDHPLYILYSSGTTGVPKCIVHGAGGTLLQHLKEQRLHVDLRAQERLFYFTTCGWMMWNWLVSGLASGATLMLYDGSPFHPDGNVLFDFAAREGINVFGTSAKYIDALGKAGLTPRDTHDLGTVRTMLSTGSPLMPESFDYVYQRVKPDLCLSSISGGTDIVSCFVLGNPVLPVHRGEVQCAGLGMNVAVFDEAGRAVTGAKGELVCTTPFPSMPVGFWNDADGSRYRAAYFERFPGVWCHGDYVEVTEAGGMVIYGRSDAVLNPGGVRIGTAEIYRQAEQIEEVVESLVIGQRWDGDVRVVLFVRLRQGLSLDDELRGRIRAQIRNGASPRHVPAKIVQVADIPRTKSGKIVELAVRHVVHGEPVTNKEALANPQALSLFADLDVLREP